MNIQKPLYLPFYITLGDASDYNKLEEANENERRTAKIMQRTLVVILPTVHFFSKLFCYYSTIYFAFSKNNFIS